MGEERGGVKLFKKPTRAAGARQRRSIPNLTRREPQASADVHDGVDLLGRLAHFADRFECLAEGVGLGLSGLSVGADLGILDDYATAVPVVAFGKKWGSRISRWLF